MAPAGNGGVDLSKVTSACREILREPNSQQLTGKELRLRIANSIRTEERLLADDVVQQHIDAVVMEYFLGQQSSLEEELEKPDSVKGKARSRPKLSKSIVNEEKPPDSKNADSQTGRSPRSSSKGPIAASTKLAEKIDRLKAYITKCGVRKIWKRELDGLSERQQVARLEELLHRELGMEGRPTLEKCKAIKARREFEEELQALDPKNVLPTRLRSRRDGPSSPVDGDDGTADQRNARDTNADETDDGDGDDEPSPTRPKLDLSAFGDPEAD